jgi:glycosyltransferase involved in cell wall biosynthesis
LSARDVYAFHERFSLPELISPMPAPVLLDLTHTSHTRARTGIQRVARSLHAALGDSALAITHDPYRGGWRPLQSWEYKNLATDSAANKRGAAWPIAARLRGRAARLIANPSTAKKAHARFTGAHGVLVPEVFSPGVAAALPSLSATTSGPRVAMFHDAIALRFPELTPPKTVARFPAYLQELLGFDGIAAVSQDSRDALLDYWRWLGVAAVPPVIALPLGVDLPRAPSDAQQDAVSAANSPVVLSVGSIEARKNHIALLDACEQLWGRGQAFQLRLVGLAHPQTGAAALARIRELASRGRPVRYDGPITDAALDAAYAACSFTVYPSLCEGFGLPVIESVARGKPCICSARGALGESARGGGCLALSQVDSPSLATAIERLLQTPLEVAALATAARARKMRTWSDYAADLLGWLPTLPRRA